MQKIKAPIKLMIKHARTLLVLLTLGFTGLLLLPTMAPPRFGKPAMAQPQLRPVQEQQERTR